MARAQAGENFVIVGFGWVGQANGIALKSLGCNVSYFDPQTPTRHYDSYGSLYASIPRLEQVREKDSPNTWYMVCVGDRVSDEGVQDISNIKNALQSLSGVQGGVILRSTVLPELLGELKFDYYVPEFLHEKLAVEECLHPYFFVVGELKGARPWPSVFHVWRARSQKFFKGLPREAAFIKYLSNIWNSVRIAFVNEFGDLMTEPSDKEKLAEIERVVDFFFDGASYLRYGRAFGGHCLPKDTRALRHWYETKGKKPLLIAATYETNMQHEALQKKLPLLPEWYSEWTEESTSIRGALQRLRHALEKYVRHPALILKHLRLV